MYDRLSELRRADEPSTLARRERPFVEPAHRPASRQGISQVVLAGDDGFYVAFLSPRRAAWPCRGENAANAAS
jgi:hypothetical protein